TCDTKIVPVAVRKQFGQGGSLGMTGGIFDVAFAPDGRTLASCMGSGEKGYVHLWDTRSGRELLQMKLKFCPQAIAFSRDGKELGNGGAAAAAALKHALKGSHTVEFQRRAEALLSKLKEQAILTPEQERQQRALAVLAILGTAEARQLLDQLAAGVPEAWLTQ